MYTFNWDYKLWNDGKNLVSAVLQHVMNALASEELEWVFGFTEAIEKERQIMMVV